jgi:hypothetical protein
LNNIIPFVARLNESETAAWITALSMAMPQERIVAFSQLKADALPAMGAELMGWR